MGRGSASVVIQTLPTTRTYEIVAAKTFVAFDELAKNIKIMTDDVDNYHSALHEAAINATKSAFVSELKKY